TVRLTRSTTGRSSKRTVSCSSCTRRSGMALLSMAARAKAGYLQSNVFRKKGFCSGGGLNSPGHIGCSQLQNIAALPTDQEGAPMVLAGVSAADKGVQ